MSTRCNILLYAPNGARVYFYTHHNGYLAGVGRHLCGIYTALLDTSNAGFPWIGAFAERLVQAHDLDGDRIFQMTAGAHADIERFYALKFPGFDDVDANPQHKDPDAYKANSDLLRFRWAKGFGAGLEAEALAAPKRTFAQFRGDVSEEVDKEKEEQR